MLHEQRGGGEAKELLSGASHVTPQGAESVLEQQEDADDLVRPTAGSAPRRALSVFSMCRPWVERTVGLSVDTIGGEDS